MNLDKKLFNLIFIKNLESYKFHDFKTIHFKMYHNSY